MISRRSILFHNKRQYLLYQTYVRITFLALKWIDEKFNIEWVYLLCFIDTAFLLCGAELNLCETYTYTQKEGKKQTSKTKQRTQNKKQTSKHIIAFTIDFRVCKLIFHYICYTSKEASLLYFNILA